MACSKAFSLWPKWFCLFSGMISYWDSQYRDDIAQTIFLRNPFFAVKKPILCTKQIPRKLGRDLSIGRTFLTSLDKEKRHLTMFLRYPTTLGIDCFTNHYNPHHPWMVYLPTFTITSTIHVGKHHTWMVWVRILLNNQYFMESRL